MAQKYRKKQEEKEGEGFSLFGEEANGVVRSVDDAVKIVEDFLDAMPGTLRLVYADVRVRKNTGRLDLLGENERIYRLDLSDAEWQKLLSELNMLAAWQDKEVYEGRHDLTNVVTKITDSPAAILKWLIKTFTVDNTTLQRLMRDLGSVKNKDVTLRWEKHVDVDKNKKYLSTYDVIIIEW